jgi:hypothetical protein
MRDSRLCADYARNRNEVFADQPRSNAVNSSADWEHVAII